jgi:RNA polymerase sigma-70 factor (ECF subfamily)
VDENGVSAGERADDSRPLDLAELYRLYSRSVARWAYLLGGPKVDPEDVMQEVFLVAYKQLPKLRNQDHLSVWLYRATNNVVRNLRRKEKARAVFHGVMEAAGLTADPGPTPDTEVEKRQTHADVYRILDQMSEKYRTVLILFELDGLSGEEVARTMNVKVSTLWVWLHRARADFLKRLEAEQKRALP